MSNIHLINTDTMTVLKSANGDDAVKKLEYWADILIPKNEFYICGGKCNSLVTWNEEELRQMYFSTTGTELVTPRSSALESYSVVLERISHWLDQSEVDDTDLFSLELKLGHKLKEQDFKPQPEKSGNKAAKASSGKSKPVTRPKEGTTSAQVWDAADYYYKEAQTSEKRYTHNDPEFRDIVIDACVKWEINRSTATTQFSRWKKHHQQA